MDAPAHSVVAAARETKHVGYLDALRGLAILAVILVHCSMLSGQKGTLGVLYFSGQRGVQLFYLVSAFTLFLSLDTRRKEELHPTFNFFVRRFFRIAPLFYLAIVANLFIHGLAPRPGLPDGLTVIEVISGFLFLNGFQPHTNNTVALGGWSIAVETSFYLCVPFIYRRVRNLQAAGALLAIAIPVAFALSYGLALGMPPSWVELFTFLWFPVQFPVFCMGIVAYYAWKTFSPHVAEWEPEKTKRWSLILIALAVEIFLLSLPNSNFRLYWSSLAMIPFMLALSIHDWRLFVNRATRWLGKISYSMYLTHFFVLLGVEGLLVEHPEVLPARGRAAGTMMLFATVTVMTAALSVVTYHLVERPGMLLGRKVIARHERGSGGIASRPVATTVCVTHAMR